MTNSTLRIFIFIETSFRSEDFNHALEHRFFENEAVLALEDDSHTVISAYAHVTGILFKVTTVRHSEEEILKVFNAAFENGIPNFTPEERKRFEQELKEREFDQEGDLVESCPFGQEFETEIPIGIRKLSDVIVRKSVCAWKNGVATYSQKRLAPSAPLSALPHSATSCRGEAFHLVTCHRVENATDSAYQTIWTEYVRNHLKKKYSETGDSYDIWASTYNEA